MSAVNVRVWAGALVCLSAFALASPSSAAPQTPDVYVYDVGVNGGNTNDIAYYGQNGGIAAYSIATQSCNGGTAVLSWFDGGGSTLHPVIGQNMFRLKSGRFEHIGQSWLKHGFCAVNEVEANCAPCGSTNCDTLGIGCADTYWATLNDGQGGQSKKMVNAAAGSHTHGGGSPTGNATIRGRLQVAVADIDPAQNAGAEWFIEGHYVTADDAAAGADDNNASWRPVNVVAVNNIDGAGPTNPGAPAIFAWPANEAGVEIKHIKNTEAGGAKTNFYLGYKVTDLGGGTWHYEYAIQNLDSDQSGGSFSVPVTPAVQVDDIGFHDVAYHSGDPYDGTDWPGVKFGGEVRWATTPFSTNANANALRWGTLYNFRFDANSPPVRGPVTLGLFKPSVNTEQTVADVWVPMGQPSSKFKQVSGPPAGGAGVDLPFTAARNGANVNLPVLAEESPAVIGQDWRASLGVVDADRSVLLVGFAGPTQGVFNRMGEMLLQRPFTRRMAGDLSLPIPADAGLVGFTFSTQAAVHTEAGWRLTNALDVTIGSQD